MQSTAAAGLALVVAPAVRWRVDGVRRAHRRAPVRRSVRSRLGGRARVLGDAKRAGDDRASPTQRLHRPPRATVRAAVALSAPPLSPPTGASWLSWTDDRRACAPSSSCSTHGRVGAGSSRSPGTSGQRRSRATGGGSSWWSISARGYRVRLYELGRGRLAPGELRPRNEDEAMRGFPAYACRLARRPVAADALRQAEGARGVRPCSRPSPGRGILHRPAGARQRPTTLGKFALALGLDGRTLFAVQPGARADDEGRPAGRSRRRRQSSSRGRTPAATGRTPPSRPAATSSTSAGFGRSGPTTFACAACEGRTTSAGSRASRSRRTGGA